jgi:hypothetical protein
VTNKNSKTQLRVVPKRHRSELKAQDFQAPVSGAQTNLFPSPRPGMLIFVYFPEVTEDEFRRALEFSKPSVVLELRTTPRFDIGRLDRKTVFQCFDRDHTKYLDLTSWGTNDRHPSDLLGEIKDAFTKDSIRFDRPVMFLLNSYNAPRGFSAQIIELVSSMKKTKPEVFAVPQFVSL